MLFFLSIMSSANGCLRDNAFIIIGETIGLNIMPASSTQDFLEIDQIREGIVILKNKALRAIMMVSSLNFALKSDEEQAAIMAQFQEFLNSLDFSVQIVIQTRRLNIAGYLEQLKSLGAEPF